MPTFPEPPPPAVLAERGAALIRLEAGAELWRVYLRGGRHATSWSAFRAYGPTSGRFDHHEPPPRAQARRILYAAPSGQTCLAEVFQDARVIDRQGRAPWLVGFRTAVELTLLDLTGSWPTRVGASMALSSGPRPRARRWSQAIHAAFPEVQGLWYPSAMLANRPAVALYERAEAALPRVPVFNRPLADPALLTPLKNAAYDLGYGLI